MKRFNNRCSFCIELRTNHCKHGDIGNRILYETDNFVVFPGLGQIVEGYVHIVTKEHYIALGEMPRALHKEFNDVQEKVRQVLSKEYQAPLFFEHGPVCAINRGGACIEHAHLHSFPVSADLTSNLCSEFPYKIVEGIADIKKQFESGVPYFFFEDNSGNKFIFEVQQSVPSQYMRRLLAKEVGKEDEWDWGVFWEIDNMKKTLKRLKGKF